MHISRKIKIFLIFFGIVVVGYLVVNLINGGGGIPASFSEARLQGALISQTIVNLSTQTAQDLEKINELDKGKQFTEALELTSQVIVQSQRIREEAVALSAEIEKMTRALSDIRSERAREAALESITDRLTLISRLINYSAYLGQLAETLRNRFTNAPGGTQIGPIIDQINNEIKAINYSNEQASQAMERFDKLVE